MFQILYRNCNAKINGYFNEEKVCMVAKQLAFGSHVLLNKGLSKLWPNTFWPLFKWVKFLLLLIRNIERGFFFEVCSWECLSFKTVDWVTLFLTVSGMQFVVCQKVKVDLQLPRLCKGHMSHGLWTSGCPGYVKAACCMVCVPPVAQAMQRPYVIWFVYLRLPRLCKGHMLHGLWTFSCPGYVKAVCCLVYDTFNS